MLSKNEQIHQCSLCEKELSRKDVKLSHRIANYARESGGERYKRLAYRVNHILEERRRKNEGRAYDIILEPIVIEKVLDLQGKENEEGSLLVCFKCIYELILSYEGR
jgi:hypothetical protein